MANADAWSSGDAYEPYIGRWSRRLAPAFLRWASVPRGAVVDVGCGTGAVSEALLDHGATSVTGVDLSPAYVEHAAKRLGGRDASFEVGDAQRLHFGDASFDAAVSGLALNFVPSPAEAAGEMARVVRPGGVVAAYVWDYAEGMGLIRRFWDAAADLDPAARTLDEGVRFPLCRPGPLRALFEGAGLQDVEVAPLDQPTVFRDFDDYWRPFTLGQGPAPSYFVGLSEGRQAALRERLRATLPLGPDRSLALVARAWAVKGGKTL